MFPSETPATGWRLGIRTIRKVLTHVGQADGQGKRRAGRLQELITQTAADGGSELQVLQGVLFEHPEGFDEDLLADEIVMFQARHRIPGGYLVAGLSVIVFALDQ